MEIVIHNGLQNIFTENDVPGYKSVNYVCDKDVRLRDSKSNIFAAEDLIKKVFK